MSEVYDVDHLDGWGFGWDFDAPEGRRYFELEWLPQKQQWQRALRIGENAAWSMQPLNLEKPHDHDDARRIVKAYVKQRDKQS